MLTALAALAWPLIFAVIVLKFAAPLAKVIESALGRKFTIKVAGNELTMEEASAQQQKIIGDMQSKLAELEKRLTQAPGALQFAPAEDEERQSAARAGKRVLWVDDNPKNNSYLVANLEEKGVRVDTALSTEHALRMFRAAPYDGVISDMNRAEGKKAGIDLAQQLRALRPQLPIFIYCSAPTARALREEARAAGVRRSPRRARPCWRACCRRCRAERPGRRRARRGRQRPGRRVAARAIPRADAGKGRLAAHPGQLPAIDAAHPAILLKIETSPPEALTPLRGGRNMRPG